MIELPHDVPINDLASFSDWVELCALLEPAGAVSAAKVADVIRDASLVGTAQSDLPTWDESFRDPDAFTDEEAAERFTEGIWGHLTYRAHISADSYPLAIEKDRVIRRYDSWQHTAGFMMLLVADASRFYPEAAISTEPSSGFPRLFEKVVEACGRGLFGGASVRFGVPRDPDWPRGIVQRINTLGERLSLKAESLEGKVKPISGDRGLDVAVRLSFGDDGPGTVVFLVQCATGKNWKVKRGEPSIAEWQDIFQWNAGLIRAIAVPWRLEAPSEYAQNFRHFDSIILDRMRLVCGCPDRFLDPSTRKLILSWCGKQIKKLPTLH